MTKKLVLHSSVVEKERVLFLCIQNDLDELKERHERWRDTRKREDEFERRSVRLFPEVCESKAEKVEEEGS